MPTPRFPHSIRRVSVGLALVTGLACDQNAPTETRAAMQPVTAEHTGEAAFVADFTATTIPLPVNQRVNTGGATAAFRIEQIGSAANGIFQIGSLTSGSVAFQGINLGLGRAGYFWIGNRSNRETALTGQTRGGGSAGLFQAIDPANSSDVLVARQYGSGRAGLFETMCCTARTAPALSVIQRQNGPGFTVSAGSAPAALFAGSSATTVVDVTGNNGVGKTALRVIQTGGGTGAVIRNTSTSNDQVALDVQTDGPGMAFIVNGPTAFHGSVSIDGPLTKPAGSFRIDHPLDPEHKYLQHSFVESPDMMNVYNGNVTLDENGRAYVELPDYFEALNQDFRYQLTAIGAPGPNLYIAQGVEGNQFRIAGGRAYAHVSWQVTGVRKDKYAEEHRIHVEEQKPVVQGELVAGR